MILEIFVKLVKENMKIGGREKILKFILTLSVCQIKRFNLQNFSTRILYSENIFWEKTGIFIGHGAQEMYVFQEKIIFISLRKNSWSSSKILS